MFTTFTSFFFCKNRGDYLIEEVEVEAEGKKSQRIPDIECETDLQLETGPLCFPSDSYNPNKLQKNPMYRILLYHQFRADFLQNSSLM